MTRLGLEPYLLPSEELDNILTNQEKEQAIAYAASRNRQHYIWKLTDMGANAMTIEQKVSEIDFVSELNIPEVLTQAAFRKIRFMENQQMEQDRRRAIEQAYQNARRDLTTEQVRRTIQEHFNKFHNGFKLTDGNREMVEVLSLWFSSSPEYVIRGYSPHKGIMLQGSSGLGKTETVRAISRHPLFQINIVSMIRLAAAVEENGYFSIPNGLVLLDDVGSEPCPVRYFGTSRNVFQELIETYYLEQQPYHRLLITTNLGGQEIEQRYGYRVRSRIREMFNVIQVTGEDMRK